MPEKNSIDDEFLPRFEHDWWSSWWRADYSWEGLAKHDCPHTHGAIRSQSNAGGNLQSYWRSTLERQPLRTDAQMGDELVADPEGKLWHIVHVPLFWADGTPAKAAWSAEKLAHLDSLCARRLQYALSNEYGSGIIERNVAYLDGAVLIDLAAPAGVISARLLNTYIQAKTTLKKASEWFQAIGCFFNEQLTLTHCEFVGGATFENCVFKRRICCQGSTVSGMASFCDSRFFSHNLFHETLFVGKVWFHHATFHGSASFARSHFSSEASFANATFLGAAEFEGVLFDGRADFDCCTYRSNFSFQNSKFNGPAFFSDNSWPCSTLVRDQTEPACERAFYNSRFSASAVFRGTGFRAFAAFDGAFFDGGAYIDRVSENEAKSNFSRELQQAIGLDDPESRLESLLGGCQTLRQAMERASDKKREHLLYQFELMTRRYQIKTPRWEKILSYLYDWSSRYGSSIARPVAVLIVVVVALGLFYGLVAGFQTDALAVRRPVEFSAAAWQPIFSGISFSAGRAFPFGPWAIEQNQFHSALIGSGDTFGSIVIRLIATGESVLSAILLFLSGLAVRRRFQIG
jgi:hypothetical protein